MNNRPFLIGIVGDSGSGKNTVGDAVAELLGRDTVTDLRLDDYHRYTREERAEMGLTALNPLVHNFPLMQEHLAMLREGRTVRTRSYDHTNGSFGSTRQIVPEEWLVVRGLFGFPNDAIRDLYDLTVFLNPEPDLLFRWKLRRDTLARGYTQAEVLKSIASHLLDSKEFVVPQAERADVVVRYELPEWEAPDLSVNTTITLRRNAARVLREHSFLDPIRGMRKQAKGTELLIELRTPVAADEVAAWGRSVFGEKYQPEQAGRYMDEHGEILTRPSLAFVEVLIARLAELMQKERDRAEV